MSLLNRRIEILLDDLAYGGDAVGRHQGRAVFVPYGLPGERVAARVVEEHRSYLRAEIASIMEPSPLRIEPFCQHFGRCGGCQWQMMDYHEQVVYKKKILEETLLHLGGISYCDTEAICHSSGRGYRNKAQLPVVQKGRGKEIGYFRKGSHHLEPLSSCPILDESLGAITGSVIRTVQHISLPGYDEVHHRGQLRHLILRISCYAGQAMLTLVTRSQVDIKPEILSRLSAISGLAGIHQNINPRRGNTILGKKWRNLWGDDYLWEELAGLRFRLSAGSFLQVNREVAEKAYQLLAASLSLEGREVLLDVYSGIGTIALILSRYVKKVVAIEELPLAVEDARASAQRNGIQNCLFIEGQAGEVLDAWGRAEVVVLDPPRKGVEESAMMALEKILPFRIAYLSCNPATLARDLKRLINMGYAIRRLFLVDMFPQTYHIESLVVLERK